MAEGENIKLFQKLALFLLMNTTRKFKLITIFFLAFSMWFLLAWIAAEELIIEKSLSKADAIVVLSGSAAYVERAGEAAAIFKQGIAPKIFLTNDGLQGGWNEKEQRNPYFAERERWELIRQGVPEEAIETLPTVLDGTNDEANLLARVSAERGLRSLLIVTSAYHSRRALWTFQRAMSRNNVLLDIGIESPATGQQTPHSFAWWLSIRGWRMVALEYIKIIYYRMIY